jgi:hypothetical protein
MKLNVSGNQSWALIRAVVVDGTCHRRKTRAEWPGWVNDDGVGWEGPPPLLLSITCVSSSVMRYRGGRDLMGTIIGLLKEWNAKRVECGNLKTVASKQPEQSSLSKWTMIVYGGKAQPFATIHYLRELVGDEVQRGKEPNRHCYWVAERMGCGS